MKNATATAPLMSKNADHHESDLTSCHLENIKNDRKAINDDAQTKLLSPLQLKQQLQIPEKIHHQILQQRQDIRNILASNGDHRLLVITGPCSLHDEKSALEYAKKLKLLSDQLSDKLMIVMRAYVEKPRTTTGWKGLAYDPARDGVGDMKNGLTTSRELLIELANIGLPLATEALNPMTMMYLDDLISWAAIGARTAESQIHREMVSNLEMPVGIKNGTDGSVTTATNAMISGSREHHCLGMNNDGEIAMLNTKGNPDTHVVLRGGNGITNYDASSIKQTLENLKKIQQANNIHAKVIVDCSHANANKDHNNQPGIALNVCKQVNEGNKGIAGIMLESHLVAGSQSMQGPNNDGVLTYGQSLTDACISWEQTESLLNDLYNSLS